MKSSHQRAKAAQTSPQPAPNMGQNAPAKMYSFTASLFFINKTHKATHPLLCHSSSSTAPHSDDQTQQTRGGMSVMGNDTTTAPKPAYPCAVFIMFLPHC